MDEQANEFSKGLFWDIDLKVSEYQLYPRQIITRVVSRGNLNDWNLIKSIFGIEKIKESVKETKYLEPKILRAMSNLFNIPVQEFRAYKIRGAMPKAWWQ